MKTLLAFVLMGLVLFEPDAAMAQRATVNGTVVNEYGEPLVGANVALPELLFGESTDVNGQYSISVPRGYINGRSITLRVVSEGYVGSTKVISLSDGTQTYDFQLTPDVLMLEEEVMTGMTAATPRRALVYDVSQLRFEALQEAPASNPLASLQGKIAGLTVVNNSGAPGDGVSVRLRGSTSITGSSQPLLIIDGVILGDDPLDIDAFDIAQVEVVKGAAAAAQYGSRGQAGIIHIKTQRGDRQPLNQTRVTLRNEFGFSGLERDLTVNRSHNLLLSNAGKYLDANGNEVDYGQETVIDREINGTSFYDNPFSGETVDAFGQFIDSGNTYSNYVAVSRNEARTNFHASLSNLIQAGVLTGLKGFRRQTARVNLDHRIVEALSFSLSGAYAQSSNDALTLSATASPGTARFNPFAGVSSISPVADLEARDGNGVLFIQADPLVKVENPLYLLENTDISNRRVRALGHIGLHYAPLSWLSLQAGLSYDRSDIDQRAFYDTGFKTLQASPVNEGAVESRSGLVDAVNLDAGAAFRKTFVDVTLRSTLQYRHEDVRTQTDSFVGESLSQPGVADPANVAGKVTTGAFRSSVFSDAYIASLGADYRRKLVSEALFMREGSSLFGENERWQHYYRISGAYRMSEEPWWPFGGGVPEFKLRASFGTAGGRPRFEAQYETYRIEDDLIVKNTLGNRSLKPERTRELEVGLNMAVGARIFLELSYADASTVDQLLLVPLPGYTGFEAQWQNAGTLESNTYEAGMYAVLVRTRDMNLDVGITFDRIRQKISKLNINPFRGGPRDAFYFGSGMAPGTIYGDAFVTSLEDLPAGADSRFFDVNDDGYVVAVGQGNTYREGFSKLLWGTTVEVGGKGYAWGMPLKRVDELGTSEAPIGNTLPDFSLGVPLNYRYKGFKIRMLWNAQIGGGIYNFTNQFSYQYGRSADQDQAGKPRELKKPAQYYQMLYDGGEVNAHFVEDGTFLRLREVALSYTFERPGLLRFLRGGVQRITIGFVGRNLFTFTDYSGFDPEVGSTFDVGGHVGQDATLYRVDNFGYPNYRTITGKLEIQF